LVWLFFGLSAEAEEKFQKLTGAQIQARFSGMEMTDEVHWGDVYRPGDFWLAPAGRSDIIRQLTVIWGSGFR